MAHRWGVSTSTSEENHSIPVSGDGPGLVRSGAGAGGAAGSAQGVAGRSPAAPRYPVTSALPGTKDAETVKDLLIGAVAKMPENLMKTLTCNQGTET